jgi:sugar phosphate permease
LFGINGLGQAVCSPAFIKILSNWFLEKRRGFIIGIWSGARNFGDIIALSIGYIGIQEMDL